MGRQVKDTCPETGKLGFKNQRAAKTAAAWARKDRGVILSAYSCPACHLWHLTSQRRRPTNLPYSERSPTPRPNF